MFYFSFRKNNLPSTFNNFYLRRLPVKSQLKKKIKMLTICILPIHIGGAPGSDKPQGSILDTPHPLTERKILPQFPLEACSDILC